MGSVTEHTKWLVKLARDLPGFDKFNTEDLSILVHCAVGLTYAFEANQFYIGDECWNISHNKIRCTRKRLNQLGKFDTHLMFELHKTLNELNLTETERILFYPLILSSANGII